VTSELATGLFVLHSLEEILSLRVRFLEHVQVSVFPTDPFCNSVNLDHIVKDTVVAILKNGWLFNNSVNHSLPALGFTLKVFLHEHLHDTKFDVKMVNLTCFNAILDIVHRLQLQECVNEPVLEIVGLREPITQVGCVVQVS